MQSPEEKKNWKYALDSIGNRIWCNTDMYLAMTCGGICGFWLGMIVWILVKNR